MAANKQTAISVLGFEARKISVSYGKRRILSDVSFTCKPGLTALLGKNGAGKTTLMRALLGALRTDGAVYLHTTDGVIPMKQLSARERAGVFSYAAQEPANLTLSTFEFVLLGCAPFTGLFSLPDTAQKERVRELFAQAGMTAFLDRPYDTLSGGEKKTVGFLRALAQNAAWLLLDEPLAGLDLEKQHAFCEFLGAKRTGNFAKTSPNEAPFLQSSEPPHQDSNSLAHTPPAANAANPSSLALPFSERKVAAALVSLHDPSLAMRYFDRILILHDGHLLAQLDKNDPAFENDYLAALQILYGSRTAYADTPFGKTVVYQ